MLPKQINKMIKIEELVNNQIDIECKRVFGYSTGYSHKVHPKLKYIKDENLCLWIQLKDYLEMSKSIIVKVDTLIDKHHDDDYRKE